MLSEISLQCMKKIFKAKLLRFEKTSRKYIKRIDKAYLNYLQIKMTFLLFLTFLSSSILKYVCKIYSNIDLHTFIFNFQMENQVETNQHNETGHSLNRGQVNQVSELQVKDVFEKKTAQKTIEKGRETRFHFERVLNFDYCLLLFSIINIVLSVFYSDADWNNKSGVASICLLFISIILIVEIAVTIFRYKAQIELEKGQRILDEEENIISSGKSFSLAVEIFILILQPYPFLNDVYINMTDNYDNISFPFKLNYILVFFGFFKLFIILRVMLIKQIYMSPRSSRLCRMYGCQSNYLYAIKCLFKDTPMLLIGIVFISSVLVFALSLRIAERDVIAYTLNSTDNNSKSGSNDISDFQNALWLTIITMTTVGYGDFYPRTTFGRVIDVILVVWGTFIVSLMVVVLTNTLNMDQSEKRALIVLNRLEAKKALKESAALLITHTCKKFLQKKKLKNKTINNLSKEEEAKVENTFYKYLTNFQSVHRTIRSMYQIDDVYEEMTRQFEFINDQINFLIDSQDTTIKNLQQYLDAGKVDIKENLNEGTSKKLDQ